MRERFLTRRQQDAVRDFRSREVLLAPSEPAVLLQVLPGTWTFERDGIAQCTGDAAADTSFVPHADCPAPLNAARTWTLGETAQGFSQIVLRDARGARVWSAVGPLQGVWMAPLSDAGRWSVITPLP